MYTMYTRRIVRRLAFSMFVDQVEGGKQTGLVIWGGSDKVRRATRQAISQKKKKKN